MSQFRTHTNEDTRSLADRDFAAIQEYTAELKKQRERELKLFRQWEWRGNSLPPFDIEPFREERARLDGLMTPDDRVARKQWLDDQILSDNEPVFIAERSPRNFLRVAWGGVWDSMRIALRPLIGSHGSRLVRFALPKTLVGFPLVWLMWYNVKYAPSQWEEVRGWHVWLSKPVLLPGDRDWPNPPTKADDDFHDKGFKTRTALLGDNMTTSRIDHLYLTKTDE